jgi:hypothetical protein
MGSIGRSLFGGGESRQEARDLTPAEFQGLRPSVANVFSTLLGFGEGPGDLSGIPQFEGDLAAGIAPGEEQMLAQLMGLFGQPGGREDLLQRTMAGEFVPTDPMADPFMSGAIQAGLAPFERMAEQFMGRQLPAAALGVGQQVGPGASAAASRFGGEVLTDIAQRGAETAAQFAFQGREMERQRQMEAIPLSQQEVQTTIQNLQAQALPRMIQELGIERGIQQFQTSISALIQALQLAGGVTSPTLGQFGTSTQETGFFPAMGSFMQGLGSMGGGFGFGG